MSTTNTPYKVGKHYSLTSAYNEVTVAYFYHNPDAGCDGFGFNVADGGGFVPEYDLSDKTTVVELELVKVGIVL